MEYESIPCNLCGYDTAAVVYQGRLKDGSRDPKKVNASSGSQRSEDTIVKCRNCGLVYVNPRLRSEEIVEGYAEGKDATFVSQVKGREKTFEAGIAFIERFQKPGKILDVGTAGGSFLHVAKKRGWQVHGCEVNRWLCDWAKKHYGLHITPGTLEQQKYPDNFFDVVTLWDVIEHVPDPSATLKEVRRILKPGGFVYLNYPDYGSNVAKIMKSRWVFLLSVHIYYFTRDTLGKMLKKEGFETKAYRSHWQTLSLGYLMHRMREYSRLLAKLGEMSVRITRTKNLPVKCQFGQTGVIAQKK